MPKSVLHFVSGLGTSTSVMDFFKSCLALPYRLPARAEQGMAIRLGSKGLRDYCQFQSIVKVSKMIDIQLVLNVRYRDIYILLVVLGESQPCFLGGVIIFLPCLL